MNDYLYHKDHKYIYKEKKNGKWRYYYEDYKKKKQEYKDALSAYEATNWKTFKEGGNSDAAVEAKVREVRMESKKRAAEAAGSKFYKNTLIGKIMNKLGYDESDRVEVAKAQYKAKDRVMGEPTVDGRVKEWAEGSKAISEHTAQKAYESVKEAEKRKNQYEKVKDSAIKSDSIKQITKKYEETKDWNAASYLKEAVRDIGLKNSVLAEYTNKGNKALNNLKKAQSNYSSTPLAKARQLVGKGKNLLSKLFKK